jgi:hypothetical protein
MMVHTYNPNNREVEAGGLRVQDQPSIHGEFKVNQSYIRQRKTNKETNKQKEGMVIYGPRKKGTHLKKVKKPWT